MGNRIRNIKILRLLAFVYDILFILLLTFTVYMLFGLIFKMDSNGFQYLLIILLLTIVGYLMFGEWLFKNTFGKYLFGMEVVDSVSNERLSPINYLKRGLPKIIFPVEGIVLLFSRSGRRLGDLWANSLVLHKVSGKEKPVTRFIIGMVVIIALYFSFSISMGLATRRSDFYRAGADYLEASGQVKITGLASEVSQSRDSVYFSVPVSIEGQSKYARLYLGRSDGNWIVYKTEFFNGHIGAEYGYSFPD
jgi:uncharacterized RDD family membrane protein YckC